MEDNNMKYKQVLDKLKKMEPVSDDAGAMVDRIMQRVEQMAIYGKRIRTMRILTYISGIAASALICLLVYETLKYPIMPVDNFTEIKSIVTIKTIHSHSLSKLNSREKTEIIEKMLKNREVQRIRKEWLNVIVINHDREVKHY